MIIYVLTVSEFFPKTHNKAGLPTGFFDRINNKTKLHTIRGNYPLWKKRFDKIDKGEAYLSVRMWQGVPYRSKQKEVFNFTKEDGIGIQKISFGGEFIACHIDDRIYSIDRDSVANNDGLTPIDFKGWFKGSDTYKPMAIIHLTPFRYSKIN